MTVLKLYADITELQPRDVSAAALRRLKFYTVLSLPFVPMLGLTGTDYDFLTPTGAIAVVVLLVSAAALLALCLNKLINRVWVRDRYLDEWEIRMKHRTMAFAFQVTLYVVAVLLFVGFVIDMSDSMSLPYITGEMAGYALFALLMLGLYTQVFSQFAMVEPIEADDLDGQEDNLRSIKGAFWKTCLLVGLFVLPPFFLGMANGFKFEPRSEIEIVSAMAIEQCGQGEVHWVSIDPENYGFSCFGDNKPAPESLNSTP